MKKNSKKSILSEQDEFVYNRMQHIAGIREEYYGFAKDKYQPGTESDERNFDKVIEAVRKEFEESGQSLSPEQEQQAQDVLQDIIFGHIDMRNAPLRARKDMWDNMQFDELGRSIAEELLGV